VTSLMMFGAAYRWTRTAAETSYPPAPYKHIASRAKQYAPAHPHQVARRV